MLSCLVLKASYCITELYFLDYFHYLAKVPEVLVVCRVISVQIKKVVRQVLHRVEVQDVYVRVRRQAQVIVPQSVYHRHDVLPDQDIRWLKICECKGTFTMV